MGESYGEELTDAELNDALTASTGRRGGPRRDPTEPRTIETWFALNQHIKEDGCDNPDCQDPRPRTDLGTNIVSEVKGKMICRFCFLSGYLSTNG